jgi:hypothetical protein
MPNFSPFDLIVAPAVFCLVFALLALNFYVDSQSLAAFLGESDFIAYVDIADAVTLPLTVSAIIALAANAGKVLLSYHLSTRDFTGRWMLKILVRGIYAVIIVASLVLTQLFFANQLLDARMDAHIATEQQRLDMGLTRQNLQIAARFRQQTQQEQMLLDAPLTAQLAALDRTIADTKSGMSAEIDSGPGQRYDAHKTRHDQAMGERQRLLTGISAKRAAIVARLNGEQQAALDQAKTDADAARTAISPTALQGQPFVQNASMLSFAQLLTTVAGRDQTQGLIVAPATLAVLATICLSLTIEFLIIALMTVVVLPRSGSGVSNVGVMRPAKGARPVPVPKPHAMAAE